MAGPTKGSDDYLALGDWNATCSMCGQKRKASYLVKNWQGQWRCPEHNEPRHPQEYVRAVPDIQTPPWTQPDSDTFVEFCTPLGMTGIAGVGIVGCAICGYRSPLLGPYDLPIFAQIILTSGSSWQVPSNWNPLNNWVECIGAGGSGFEDTNPGGGGGGAYAIGYNLNISGTVQYSVGTGSTWFNGTSFADASVAAEGGLSGSDPTGGVGGKAINSRGNVKYDGGDGGNALIGTSAGAGGGGAGGPNGAGGRGADAGTAVGGNGGTANGGLVAGGIGGTFPIKGADGNSNTYWNSTHGVGSGGGGACQQGGNLSAGGNGGSYGGGGGGGGAATIGSRPGPGLIVISYVANDPVVDDSGVPVQFPVTVPVQINQTWVPVGTVGTPYMFRFTGWGGSGNYTWSVPFGVPQPLPDGLSLDAATGIITGTPTGPMITNSLIRLTDTFTGLRAEQTIVFSIIY